MTPSVRTRVSAGLATGLVTAVAGAAVLAPVAIPEMGNLSAPAVTTLPSAAVELTAALQPLLQPGAVAEASAATAAFVGADATEAEQSAGDWIINAYYSIQPWVEYGVQLFAWAFEWLPWPIGLLAPQAFIVYDAWQPFAESVAFSLAFLVDGQFDLVLPTLAAGIQTGLTNLVQGEIDWILSFFPPLPPIGFAAATAPAVRVAARDAAATGADASAADTPAVAADASGDPAEGASEEPEASTTQRAATDVAAAEAVTTDAELAATDLSPRRPSRAQRPAPAASAAAAAEGVSGPAADADPASASGTQQNSTSRPAIRASRGAAVKQRDKAPGAAATKSAGRR